MLGYGFQKTKRLIPSCSRISRSEEPGENSPRISRIYADGNARCFVLPRPSMASCGRLFSKDKIRKLADKKTRQPKLPRFL